MDLVALITQAVEEHRGYLNASQIAQGTPGRVEIHVNPKVGRIDVHVLIREPRRSTVTL